MEPFNYYNFAEFYNGTWKAIYERNKGQAWAESEHAEMTKIYQDAPKLIAGVESYVGLLESKIALLQAQIIVNIMKAKG